MVRYFEVLSKGIFIYIHMFIYICYLTYKRGSVGRSKENPPKWQKTPPKWHKNDLVSGGHGRAAKLGACVNWVIGSAPVQISERGLDGALS